MGSNDGNRQSRSSTGRLDLSGDSHTQEVVVSAIKLTKWSVPRGRLSPPMACSRPIPNFGTCPRRRWLVHSPWQGAFGYNIRICPLIQINRSLSQTRMQVGTLSSTLSLILPEYSIDSLTSLLLSYLFLVDVVHSAHVGTIPFLSSSELFIRMPSSPYYFKPMYACLISEAGTLPANMKSEEDSLLLLTAICSDILYAHYTFSGITHPSDEAKSQSVKMRNPYVPLSAESEALRHKRNLDAALTRWYLHFGHLTSANILSLFYFCRLVHTLPMMLSLPRLAGYAPAKPNPLLDGFARPDSIIVTDEAINFAWLILDNIDAGSESENTNVSIWLPVVLFYATLTVWYHLQRQTSSSSLRTGTLRTLRMFRAELERLPWPCCTEMCFTLDRLMERQDDV